MDDIYESIDPIDENPAVDDGGLENEEPSSVIKHIVAEGGEFERTGEIFKEGALGKDVARLALPGANPPTMQGPVGDVISNMDEAKIKELASSLWSAISAKASETVARELEGYDPTTREGSKWRNALSYEERNIGIAAPRLGNYGNAPMTGIQAMAKAVAYTGIGAVLQIPLYHSGFHITIRVGYNSEYLELDRLLSLNKMTLGRVTRGRVFSQTDVYLKMALVNFVLDHVIDTTWVTTDKQELKKVIKIADIDAMIHGMAVCKYPKGYPFSQPCIGDVKKCSYVAEGNVRVDKLYWVDNSVFTDYQRKQMASRTVKIDQTKYDKYQEEFGVKNSSVFNIGNTHFKLAMPSIAEYELAGFSWIASIQTSTEEAFQQRLSEEERDSHIFQVAQTTAMRQYSHWVERVTFRKDGGDDDGWVEGRDEIAEQLAIWTSDVDMAEKFYASVNRFISDITVGVCAVPNFTCPKCKARQNTEAGRFEYLIRLDVADVFFTLYSQQLSVALAVESI